MADRARPIDTPPSLSERPHAEARVLYRITKDALGADLTLEAMVDAIAGHLADHGFERVAVTLTDASTGEVRIEAARGLSPAEQKRGRYRRGEGIVGKVVAAGKPTVVPSVAEEPAFLDRTRSREKLDLAHIAFVCVPIVTVRGEVLGTISVDRPSAPEKELHWDRRLLTVAATVIAEPLARRLAKREDAASDGRDRQWLEEAAEQNPTFRELVGASHAMCQVFRLVRQVAPFDTPVLLRGESGTGKELVARAIHAGSARAAGPFVSVNCGALPETLLESELFGHAKGAFTGAVQSRRGRFDLANGGTLFLDEVAELPPSSQVKLLRALQEGEIHPVGEERARRVDVRIIAATNADLEKGISSGRLREDLFYRLNVFPIFLPPLRDRKTDVTLLADHFVEKYARLHGKKVVRISTPAIDLMTAYHWPGNVRELENCIARAVVLASEEGVIRAHHLPPTLQTGASSGTTQRGSLEVMMMRTEREILIEAMKNASGNMTSAAHALATTPRILAYRLRRHGLHDELALLRRKRRR